MEKNHHDLSIGPVLLAIAAVFFFTALDGIAKDLGSRHSTIDVVSIRYLSGLIWSAVVAAFYRPPWPSVDMVKAHSIRAFFYAGTSFLFFYAISVLPMVETMVFTYIAPIFMAILGRILLKEKVPASTALAILLSFVGILVIAFGKGFSLDHLQGSVLGIIEALGSAGTYALANVLLRARAGDDTIAGVVVLQNILASTLVLPFAFLIGDPIGALRSEWMLGLAMGALGTIGQFMMATALHRAPAARIGTVEYTNIIWATLIGIFIFQEWPHWTVYAGAALIIAGSFMLLKAKKS
jgi:drug/metabolite transporter (DMT)-like permease